MNSVKPTLFQQRVMAEAIKNGGPSIRYGQVELFNRYGVMIVQYNAVGAFDRMTDTIFICPEDGDASSTKTMFHELAHSTYKHLGRTLSNKRNSAYGKEECIAERSAYKLMCFFSRGTMILQLKCEAYQEDYGKTLTPTEWQEVEVESNRVVEFILQKWIPIIAAEHASSAA